MTDKPDFDTLPTSRDINDFTGKIFYQDCMNLLAALPDRSVSLILTDFPYGVTQAHYDEEQALPDYEAVGREMFRVIQQDGAVITTAAQPFTSKLVMLWEKYFRYEWIWRKTRKTNFLNAKKMPLSAHESILVFGHKLPRYYPQMRVGEKHEKRTRGTGELYGAIKSRPNVYDNLYYPDSVLTFGHDSEIHVTKTQRPNKAKNHSNQKPLKLWKYLVKTYSCEGDIVLDCFSGSGVTAVAAIATNRQYILCDSHLPYVELSRQRIQKPIQLDMLDSHFKQDS